MIPQDPRLKDKSKNAATDMIETESNSRERALYEKLFMEFPAYYKIQSFITMITKACP
jgi:hypothetical protein